MHLYFCKIGFSLISRQKFPPKMTAQKYICSGSRSHNNDDGNWKMADGAASLTDREVERPSSSSSSEMQRMSNLNASKVISILLPSSTSSAGQTQSEGAKVASPRMGQYNKGLTNTVGIRNVRYVGICSVVLVQLSIIQSTVHKPIQSDAVSYVMMLFVQLTAIQSTNSIM